MIAFGPSARKYAKRAGAPAAVFQRAAEYREIPLGSYSAQWSAYVRDRVGSIIWRRRLTAETSQEWSVAKEWGWVS